jgi:hypothetical protein
MKKLLSLIVGFALFLALVSFISGKMEKPRLTSEQIAAPVPLGASPAQVLAILDAEHIEHFGYDIDPDNKRFIFAVSRGSKWSLVREDHSITFRFDEHDRLVSKEPRTTLNGP